MPHVNLRSPVGRVLATVAAWFLGFWRQEDVPESLRITPPDEPKPARSCRVHARYTYLDCRYAGDGCPDIRQIEALLGFAPPSPAFADVEWWTGSGGADDRHRAAWTAARRSAAPQLGARIVAFERLP